MNMKRVWISILVTALVFTLAPTFTQEGETQSPSGIAAAYANAWYIHLGPARYDGYASGSAYAAAAPSGAANAGNWSASAYVYMHGKPKNGSFTNGGGGSNSQSHVLTVSGSSSGSANVTSMLGSAADSASS